MCVCVRPIWGWWSRPIIPLDWRIDPNFLEGNNPHPTEGLIISLRRFSPPKTMSSKTKNGIDKIWNGIHEIYYDKCFESIGLSMGFMGFSMRNALVFHWCSISFWIQKIGFSKGVLLNRGWPAMWILRKRGTNRNWFTAGDPMFSMIPSSDSGAQWYIAITIDII